MGRGNENIKIFLTLSLLIHFILFQMAKMKIDSIEEETFSKSKPVQWVDLKDLPKSTQKKINRNKQLAHTELARRSKSLAGFVKAIFPAKNAL